MDKEQLKAKAEERIAYTDPQLQKVAVDAYMMGVLENQSEAADDMAHRAAVRQLWLDAYDDDPEFDPVGAEEMFARYEADKEARGFSIDARITSFEILEAALNGGEQ